MFAECEKHSAKKLFTECKKKHSVKHLALGKEPESDSDMLPSSAKFDNGFDLIDEDGVTETRSKRMINLDFYVPPDERFSPTKLAEVLTLAVQAVTHFVVPESKALLRANLVNSFRSFQQLRGDLYSRRSPRQPVAVDAQVMDRLKASLPSRKTYMQVSKMVKETPVMFPIPQVIEGYTWPFGTSTMGRPKHGPKKHGPSTAQARPHSASARHGPTSVPCLGLQVGPWAWPRHGTVLGQARCRHDSWPSDAM